MDYSPESIRFLHLAYAAIIVAQVVYAIWLYNRWRHSSRPPQDPR